MPTNRSGHLHRIPVQMLTPPTNVFHRGEQNPDEAVIRYYVGCDQYRKLKSTKVLACQLGNCIDM
jgi:hypothetical protein